jgi:hypothetical protein
VTLEEQIQFVQGLIAEQDRRATVMESQAAGNDEWVVSTRALAARYRTTIAGLREVAATLHRFQSLAGPE